MESSRQGAISSRGPGGGMDVDQALSALTTVEEKMAGLYEGFARFFDADPDARRCFATLALQERGHANQLGLQRRMARSAKAGSEVELDRAEIEAVVQKIDLFQRQNPRPPLPHAILFALGLESGEVEKAYRNLLATASPELAALARGMIVADERHAELLRDLMEKKRRPRAP